jgi:ribosomal protein S18 acetylase RimI-like enzyme
MIEFATADEAGLDAFLAVSADSPFHPQLKEYLGSLLRQRATRPEWCLLGLEAGAPVARAALWAPAGQTVPTDFVLIDADWQEEGLSSGHALLARLHELALDLGAEALSHHVDDPPAAPQYQENEEARIRLLEESGYTLLRDGLRWRYSRTSSQQAPPDPRLAFRTLAEVGDEAFMAAIASTYEGTRDSWLSRSMEEQGVLGAARADFVDAQAIEYEPEWWELAYTDDDTLAGVIMAARNPSSAVVWYVGVVPEARGRGLARQLVRRGTERLLAAGAEEIRGDCDLDNVGMVKAFERAGYEQFARRCSYRLKLTT